jgi:methyl-accepting chemotaxis protein
MAPLSQRRITNLLVKKRLQLKFIGVLGFMMLAMLASLWLVNIWGVQYVMGGTKLKDVVFLGYIHQIRLITLVAGLFVFIVNFLFVIGITHFFAGPIYRFERVFEQMEKGDLNIHVRLRKHDELQDTAMALNRAIVGLRNKFGIQGAQ